MKNRRCLPRLLTAVVLFLASPTGWAGDAVPANAADDEYRFEGSVMEEAARAVFGRVFGVSGEAADIPYHEVELSEVSPRNAAIRSALIPGWGQRFNGESTKAAVYFLSFVGSASAAVLLYTQSRHSWDDYAAKGVKDDALYNDYQRQQTQAAVLAGAAAVFWGLSILDAHRNAYQKLYSQNTSVQLTYDADRTELRWNRRF